MKKILLSIALVSMSIAATAQTVYFEENFDDLTGLPADWTNVDVDGDGFVWSVVQIQDAQGNPVFTPLLRSASWVGGVGALTPDNWAITPAIDLTSAPAGEAVLLTYHINAVDPDWDIENYTVYVGTSNDPTVLESSNISFTEETLDGYNEFLDNSLRTIDVSALVGETIYVGFRHYGVSDQFTIEVDDIKVASENLGVSEVSTVKSKLYVVASKDGNYRIHLPETFETSKTSIEVYSMTGAKVNNSKYAQTIDFNFLPAGIYILKANDGKEVATTKFIKK